MRDKQLDYPSIYDCPGGNEAFKLFLYEENVRILSFKQEIGSYANPSTKFMYQILFTLLFLLLQKRMNTQSETASVNVVHLRL